MSIHPTAPINTSAVTGFIAHAVGYATAVRQEHDGPEDLPARTDALPGVLKPYAIDQLRAHAVVANDALERLDALRVLEWLVTA